MWLASLRRLVHGKTRSRKTIKQTRQQRRRILPALEHLENRIVPSTIDVIAGDTTGLINAFIQANIDYANTSTSDTIVLNSNSQPSSVYTFTAANNGSNVLPVITAKGLTITGNGSTLNAAGYGRLLDVAAGGSVTVSDLTLGGGTVSGATAQGGAVYSSGSLTLKNDIIGRKAIQTRTISYNTTGRATKSGVTTKAIGGTNKATGGTGGSGQGAGIYVAGGSLNVTSCTIASNQASGGGSGNGQGGGIYSNGSTLTLINDLIGQKVTRFKNTNGQTTKTVYTGGPNLASGGVGGIGQGGGLYVSGGTVNLTNNEIWANRAVGAAGTAAIAGGNAQGGGIFATATKLTVTGGSVDANGATGGGGGGGTVNHFAGSAGGNAQGGGIYANATTLIVSGGAVNDNGLFNGQGGSGAAGTSKHVSGGAGGASGLDQGGGIFAQGGSLTLQNVATVNNNSGGANVSGGQGGAGDNGAGGAGGAGSNGDGGGVFASGTTVYVESGAAINDNTVQGAGGGYGGNGGVSKAGGAGGNAGYGLGGGMFVQGGSVSVTGAATQISVNTVIGGPGGYGGAGGAAAGGASGGIGGESDGGGLYVLNAPVTFTGATSLITLPQHGDRSTLPPGINANTVEAGRGGNGGADTKGPGANGAAGGATQGAGLFVSGTGQSVTLGSATTLAYIIGNTAEFGAGGSGGLSLSNSAAGAGGTGGNALGGGAAIIGDPLTENNTTYEDNSLLAGSGGTGGSVGKTVGKHGNGGAAQGGGLYVSGSSGVSILNSLFFANDGTGGGGGIYLASTSQYGTGGNAEGGGLYADNSDNSTVNVLNSTFDINLLSGGVAGSSNTKYGGATEGGGLFASGGSLALTNDTVAWNELYIAPYQGSPGASGGGLATAGSTLSLTNTIIALDQIYTNNGSPTTQLSYDDFDGSAVPNDDNLIGNSTSYTNYSTGGYDPKYAVGGSQQLFVGSLSFPAGTFYSGQNPANNGGLIYTLPLVWNTSPAIDTGDPSAASTIASAEGVASANATDARGFARVIGGTIDIGATETQVVLSGSAAPPIVNPGGTITYTLEVVNSESTAANVTLTDALDPNTAYQSGSGTGWTVTAPSSSSGGKVTATASVAANTMATLTITVNVSGTVANGTTIANTASITPTGSSATIPQRSTTMNTNVGSSVATTSTSLTASANPTVFGQSVVFTATVTASSGTPTGIVTFEDGSTVLGTANLDSNGVATLSYSGLSIGSSHSITAVYGGDSNDSGSTSSAVSHTVNQDGTTAVVTSSASNPVFGQSVTFTATVSANLPGSGTPTGSVTFKDGSTVMGTVTLINGEATLITSTLPVGSDSITVIYSGDTNFTGSTSSSLSQVVDKDSTTTKLTSSAKPSVYGQSVTFTATVSPVSPSADTPTGTVTFFDGSSTLGTGTLSGGVATFTTSALSVATHSITASYGGDTNDAGSTTQSALSQVVNKDSTTTTLTSSTSTSVYSQPVSFTVTVSPVSPGAGTPTGTVSIYNGSNSLGTGTLSNGTATVIVSSMPVGSDSITASYSGDGNDAGSTTSSALSQTVNQDSTTTLLTSSASTSAFGQGVTFTATVSAKSPGTATPTGNVDFVDTTTGNDLGTYALSGGTASVTISNLTAGSHAIEAIYLGQSGAFLGSTSSSVTQTISQSIIVLASTANGALSLSGNASINVLGNVIVDSSSTSALNESGNASIKAAAIDVFGGVSTSGTATLSPAPVTGFSPVSDPLANLTGPSINGLTNYGAVHLSGNSSLTLCPGIYTSIRASGNASLTLNPGVYIIEGGGMTVTGNASISGSGVMIYNTSSNYPDNTGSYGGVTLSGNGTFELSAPTTGEYAGIVLFQPSANTRAISLSGNATDGLGGTIYAPAALVYVSGNGSINGALVVNQLSLSGNATSTQTVDGTTGGNADGTAGQLLAGDVDVYVNNSDGDLTADELARIQAAVNAVDAVTAPYGVTVAEVSDPTLANVTLSMGTNSAAGNYGQGVLGCYTTTGQITLIQGWNWYGGADPTQIGADQYDLQTTVTHELGHALGLGHSGDPTSVMYASLAPATVVRTLTTEDLNIPDAASGADAQMAAGPRIGAAAGAALGSAASIQGMSAAGSTNLPSNASPLSGLDQLIANLALLLTDARNIVQAELSSLTALWQQADAISSHRLDAMLNLMMVARLKNDD